MASTNKISNGDHVKNSNAGLISHFEEIEIPVPWGKVAGKWWGSRNKQPVLALHGWQDNCGTFDRLCPLLSSDISILCIDLPGHGHSSHYPAGLHYYIFWDGISLIRRIVKHFNWQNIILMGHSLGGALCFLYAAIYPDEVYKFISIDMAGPAVRDPERIAKVNGESIDKFLKYETLCQTKQPCYSYEAMVNLVLDAYGGSVDRQSVEVLLKRGMKLAPRYLHTSTENKYLFNRDVRLKVVSMGLFTTEQVLAYAKKITCKVLNIRGIPGMKFENPSLYNVVIETMQKNAEQVIFKEIPGTHHLHLCNPERIANIVSEFLES